MTEILSFLEIFILQKRELFLGFEDAFWYYWKKISLEFSYEFSKLFLENDLLEEFSYFKQKKVI